MANLNRLKSKIAIISSENRIFVLLFQQKVAEMCISVLLLIDTAIPTPRISSRKAERQSKVV